VHSTCWPHSNSLNNTSPNSDAERRVLWVNTSSHSNTLCIFTHCCVKRAHLQHVHVTAIHKTASICSTYCCRLCLKCDGTGTETRFCLLAKQTSSFKPVGASVQSTTSSQGVRISGSNAGYTMFQGRVKSTCYPLHSPVSPSLPLPCVTMCHHISTGLYQLEYYVRQGLRACCSIHCVRVP